MKMIKETNNWEKIDAGSTSPATVNLWVKETNKNIVDSVAVVNNIKNRDIRRNKNVNKKYSVLMYDDRENQLFERVYNTDSLEKAQSKAVHYIKHFENHDKLRKQKNKQDKV